MTEKKAKSQRNPTLLLPVKLKKSGGYTYILGLRGYRQFDSYVSSITASLRYLNYDNCHEEKLLK